MSKIWLEVKLSDSQISTDEIENNFKQLLEYIGEDSNREGLLETPLRNRKAILEWFEGYNKEPSEILNKMFQEVNGYKDLIILKDIHFNSHCEHHMAPIIGKAHIGYIPDEKVVGISKLARLVDCFAHRFQIQERMTSDISNTLFTVLSCKGVAVIIEAEHFCMSTRGVKKKGAKMVTCSFNGILDDLEYKNRFFQLIRG